MKFVILFAAVALAAPIAPVPSPLVQTPATGTLLEQSDNGLSHSGSAFTTVVPTSALILPILSLSLAGNSSAYQPTDEVPPLSPTAFYNLSLSSKTFYGNLTTMTTTDVITTTEVSDIPTTITVTLVVTTTAQNQGHNGGHGGHGGKGPGNHKGTRPDHGKGQGETGEDQNGLDDSNGAGGQTDGSDQNTGGQNGNEDTQGQDTETGNGTGDQTGGSPDQNTGGQTDGSPDQSTGGQTEGQTEDDGASDGSGGLDEGSENLEDTGSGAQDVQNTENNQDSDLKVQAPEKDNNKGNHKGQDDKDISDHGSHGSNAGHDNHNDQDHGSHHHWRPHNNSTHGHGNGNWTIDWQHRRLVPVPLP